MAPDARAVTVNLKDTGIDLGPRFRKEAGLEGQLSFELLPRDSEPTSQPLADIDSLIENPLPQGFQSMISFTEIDPDEDFMEYIVPITENDPLSNIPGEKGESIC